MRLFKIDLLRLK